MSFRNSDNNYLIIPFALSGLTRAFIGSFNELTLPFIKTGSSDVDGKKEEVRHDVGRKLVGIGAVLGATITAIPRLRLFSDKVNSNSSNNKDFIVEWAMVFGSTLAGSLFYDLGHGVIKMVNTKLLKKSE